MTQTSAHANRYQVVSLFRSVIVMRNNRSKTDDNLKTLGRAESMKLKTPQTCEQDNSRSEIRKPMSHEESP
jgi:hypothetical protein